MSRASPVNMSSSPEQIYRYYSDLYQQRQGIMERYGSDMHSKKYSKESLMIVVQAQINDQRKGGDSAGRGWSMDQIIRNTVTRQASPLSARGAQRLLGKMRSGSIEVPEWWKAEDGSLLISGVAELRALNERKALKWEWDQLKDEYHLLKEAGEAEGKKLVKKKGKMIEGETDVQYAKRIISQYYFGSP